MLTQERLKELLHYDPDTGVFTRVKTAGSRAQVGTVVGSIGAHGYLSVCIDRVDYLLHRLAFLYVTGELPKYVDHVNGCRSDNRWSNLRGCASQAVNMQNQRRAVKRNTTGYLGVSDISKMNATNPFAARIVYHGKFKHLGCFPTAEAAHAAYLKAKRELHEGNTL
jgi:hypothetical protein